MRLVLSTKEYSSRGLSFFDFDIVDSELRKISIDTTSIITFKCPKENIIRGIKSFEFSPQIGVISYVDTNDVKWVSDRYR